MSEELWEVKYNLRIAIHFQWLWFRNGIHWETFSALGMLKCILLVPDWFPLFYSNQQVSFLLPGYHLGSYFYNGSAFVFHCPGGPSLASVVSLLPLWLLKRSGLFLSLLGVHWGGSGCQPSWAHGPKDSSNQTQKPIWIFPQPLTMTFPVILIRSGKWDVYLDTAT